MSAHFIITYVTVPSLVIAVILGAIDMILFHAILRSTLPPKVKFEAAHFGMAISVYYKHRKVI